MSIQPTALIALAAASAACTPAFAQAGTTARQPFQLHEATITSIRTAVATKAASCESIVAAYLKRIAALDRAGSQQINSIIVANPQAVTRAREIDRLATGQLGPLACAPLIIKDNIDVAGLPTTAGSLALAQSMPPDDATQIRRLKAAGAIVLAKSNLAEFAWTPHYSESSIAGMVRNPYDTARTAGGSSGGTAAAVAANFGVAGLGTDTGASIRGPAALQNLVGLRPTMGASSRDGVVPIWLSRDVVGPMARTVADAALLFEATQGYDAKDSATQAARTAPPFSARSALIGGALQGMRIGVMRQMVDTGTADPEVLQRFAQAITDLRSQGAVVVDLEVPQFREVSGFEMPNRMEYDFNLYLESLGPDRVVKSFAEVVRSGQYLQEPKAWLQAQVGVASPQNNPKQMLDEQRTTALRNALVAAMDREYLSVVIYPTWTRPPRLLTHLAEDGGNNNLLMAQAGLPAITIPMGNTHGNLPSGLQMAGRPFSEAVLFSAAYGFEQATRHRTAPEALGRAALD